MSDGADDLHDYDKVRRRSAATMTVIEVRRPLLVLGSRQSLADLRPGAFRGPVRRRRGGGGAVLTQPGDLWVDWWIPTADPRWIPDVRASAVAVGGWWAVALEENIEGRPVVHEGPLAGAEAHRVACFAGRGPGEVFVGDRKAVGLTQWRVREGTLVSTILPAHDSLALVAVLADPAPDLAAALDHHTLTTLGVSDVEAVQARLGDAAGPWSRERLLLDT